MERNTKIYVLKHKDLKNPLYFRQLKHISEFTGLSYDMLQKRFYTKGIYTDEIYDISLSSFQDGKSKISDFI